MTTTASDSKGRIERPPRPIKTAWVSQKRQAEIALRKASTAERTAESASGPQEPEEVDFAYMKRVATVRAQAAMAGFELVERSDGSFVAKSFGVFREFPHLAAAQRFLEVSGARREEVQK
jgi:hypothetical protein